MPRGTDIDSPTKFAKRLKQARQDEGLSQRQLAAATRCTAAYISRLEAGARSPSLQMVQEIAKRVHVSPSWLATGKNDEEKDGIDPAYVRRLERDVDKLRTLLRTICDMAEDEAKK